MSKGGAIQSINPREKALNASFGLSVNRMISFGSFSLLRNSKPLYIGKSEAKNTMSTEL